MHQIGGFIGLGTMGGPMADNLLAKGFPVYAYDIDSQNLKKTVDRGGLPADSPCEIARRATIAVLSLPNYIASREVLVGPRGLVAAKKRGFLIVNTSTIAPAQSQELSDLAVIHDMRYLEAPISRGIQGAIAGTLCFLVGGRTDDFDEARPVLEAMGTEIFYIGSIGAALTMKLVNNSLSQGTKALIAETVAMGVKGGLDPELILSTITKCSGDSYLLREKLPRMISRNYHPGMMIDMGYKDLDLVLQLARDVGAEMPMAASARDVYSRARSQGLGRADTSALVTLYDNRFQKTA